MDDRVEKVVQLNDSDLVLNDFSQTRMDENTDNLSFIDLSPVSLTKADKCLWYTINDSLGSDHFPICIKYSCDPTRTPSAPKFNVKRADWVAFITLSIEFHGGHKIVAGYCVNAIGPTGFSKITLMRTFAITNLEELGHVEQPDKQKETPGRALPLQLTATPKHHRFRSLSIRLIRKTHLSISKMSSMKEPI